MIVRYRLNNRRIEQDPSKKPEEGGVHLCSIRSAANATRCGQIISANDRVPTPDFFRPWHVVHERLAVLEYVASLGQEAYEWLGQTERNKPKLICLWGMWRNLNKWILAI